MKALKIFAISMAVAVGFSACMKEPVNSDSRTGKLVKETLSASFLTDGLTKTATADGGLTVTWAAGDKVYYYTADGGEVRNCTIDAAGASATLDLERGDSDVYYNLVYAGGSAPVFSTKSGAGMVFDGVKPEQNGTFAGANISVGRAVPGNHEVSFKPVVPILKFTTARPDVKTVVLTGGLGTEKVAGSVSVDPTAASPVASLSGEGYASITVTIDTPAAGTYYIAVLPGTYANGFTLTLKDDLGRVIGKLPANSSVNVAFGNSMINFGSSDGHLAPAAGCPASDGALSGAFSVSDTRIVYFSKGNLWSNTTATPQTWSFEDKQYDYTPSAEGKYDASHVSHFFWETTGNYGSGASCVTETGAESDIVDWGAQYCAANNLAAGTWRTLTTQEWQYLLGTRGSGNTCFRAGVNVCGKSSCLVIAPDGNSTPIADSYNAEQWSTAEANGFVCLPVAGYRDGSDATYVGFEGDYWSSSASNGSGAYFVYFTGSDVYPNRSDYRRKGYSVRLVSDGFVRPVPVYSDITLPASVAHGTVSVTGSTTGVRSGSTVTLALTPDSGYELAAITVTDAESHAVVVSGDGSTRTFTMPGSDVTVSVKFKLVGALDGVFSISDTKKVHFSKGNLWSNTTVTPQTWSFEDRQYDYTPLTEQYYDDSHVCHFFFERTGNFGSSRNVVTSSGAADDTVDWGEPYCTANGIPAGTWRTLNYDEWRYLISGSVRKGKAKIKVTVCDRSHCLVLAPDDSTMEIAESYDADEWAIAEANGFVCLPAAGYRAGPSVNSVNVIGRYWANSAFAERYAIGVDFNVSLYIRNTGTYTSRSNGYAIRLVTEE